MKNKIKNKKGVTLIELMIILAIISIMTMISLAMVASNKGTVQLRSAADEMMAVLREAQNYSLTGKGITTNCSTYIFTATPATPNDRYTISNEGGGACTAGSTQNYSLGNGITISYGQPVTFTAPHGNVSGAGDITLTNGSASITITVTLTGVITKGVVN